MNSIVDPNAFDSADTLDASLGADGDDAGPDDAMAVDWATLVGLDGVHGVPELGSNPNELTIAAPANTPSATHEALAIGRLLVVPSDNVSRGGLVLPPDHPDVRALVHTIDRGELAHDVGVRPLPQPLPRAECPHPCCGGAPLHRLPVDRKAPDHHTHRLDYGFSRYVAHRVLGRRTIECKIKARTDDEATRIGVVENLNRSAPTDYQIAIALAAIQRRHQWDCARIALEVGAQEHDVEALIRIVERCPPDLVERFRVTPTRDVRRALARISRLTGRTPAEAADRMRAEWARHEAATAAAPAGKSHHRKPPIGPAGIGRQGVPNPLGRPGLLALRDAAAGATEWFDADAGVWRPLRPEDRRLLAAVLGHAVAPKATRRPLRGGGGPSDPP